MYEVHATAFKFYYIHLLQGQSLWCSSWLWRASSWKPFWGSVNPELSRVFLELIIRGQERTLCSGRLILNCWEQGCRKKLHGGRKALSLPDSQVDLCVPWTTKLDKLLHLVALCPPALVALINRVEDSHSVWGCQEKSAWLRVGDSNVWVTLFLPSPCADPLRLSEVGSQSYLLTSWTPDGIDF